MLRESNIMLRKSNMLEDYLRVGKFICRVLGTRADKHYAVSVEIQREAGDHWENHTLVVDWGDQRGFINGVEVDPKEVMITVGNVDILSGFMGRSRNIKYYSYDDLSEK